MAKNKLARILVIAIAFVTIFTNSIYAQTDSRLNGKWVQSTDEVDFELVMNNGNFEELYNGVLFRRGTYTTTTREITIIPTHIHGGGFNTLLEVAGIYFGLEPKWYSFNEFIITTRTALLELGASEREADEFVETAVSGNTTSTYSVDDNTLILVSSVLGQNFTVILNKK